MITYQASCHCGAVSFEFDSEIIQQAMQCTCSICISKNSIMSDEYFQPDRFRLLSGQPALALYQWGDKEVNHWFCKHCGVHTFHDGTAAPGKCRVNLGCVEGIDSRSLPLRTFDGRNLL